MRRVLVAGLLASVGCGVSERDARPDAPNVLVILADQWRGMDLGCAGNDDVRTPNLDRLAAEGILYERAFANAPLCAPSRAQMLTGVHPLRNGVLTNNMELLEGVATLPRILGVHGYRAGYVGKWHLGGFPELEFVPPGPERAGFDDLWAVWGRSHQYFDSWYTTDTPERMPSEGYAPDRQTDAAIGYLERCAEEDAGPFLLFVSYGPPHPPFDQVPERHTVAYDAGSLRERPNVSASSLPGRTDERRRTELAQYYAACTAIDENVGRLTAALDRLGLAQDTIVVFTSDHGGLMGEHGCFNKQQPFEEAVRIPLVLRWPTRIEAGTRSDVLFSMVDFAPTILGLLGLAGVEGADGMEGNDLAWSALGREGEAPRSVYLMELVGLGPMSAHGIHTWRAVRTPTHLYAEDLGGPWLLYDLREDPFQRENLVEREDLEATRGELADELRGWYQRLGERYRSGVEHLHEVGRADVIESLRAIHARSPDDAELRRAVEYLDEGGSRTNRRF
ncbi:MAG: sulfatase [Planctomycetota bacterium]|nr:sulfatase [Planctomycetota bacterium]